MKKIFSLFVLCALLVSCEPIVEPFWGKVYFNEYCKFFPTRDNEPFVFVSEAGEKLNYRYHSGTYQITSENTETLTVTLESVLMLEKDGASTGDKVTYGMEIEIPNDDSDKLCKLTVYVKGKTLDEGLWVGRNTYEIPREEICKRKSFDILRKNNNDFQVGKVVKNKGLTQFTTLSGQVWKLK